MPGGQGAGRAGVPELTGGSGTVHTRGRGMGARYGGVVYHRWFADGAGWAYHPDRSGGSPAGHKELSEVLNERRRGPLEFPAPGGVLWGEQVTDADCPDYRAVNRDPTILRAVYLPAAPAPAEQAAVLDALRRFAPTGPGADPALALAPALVRGPASGSKGPWWALLALAVLAAGAGLVYFSNRPHDTPEVSKGDPQPNTNPTPPEPGPQPPPPIPGPGPQQPPEPKADDLAPLVAALRTVPGVGGKDDSDVIAAYFRRYTAPAVPPAPKPDQAPEHPDVAFARRFPTAAPQPKGSWSAAVLRAKVAELHTALTGKPPAGPDVTEQLAAVERAADYPAWLQERWRDVVVGRVLDAPGAKPAKRFAFALDAPAPKEVTAFARRFAAQRPANVTSQTEVAEKYLPVLTGKWGVNGVDAADAKQRPALVCYAVVGFLTNHPVRAAAEKAAAGNKPEGLAKVFADFYGRWKDTPNASPHEYADDVVKKLFKNVATGKAAQPLDESDFRTGQPQTAAEEAYNNRLGLN